MALNKNSTAIWIAVVGLTSASVTAIFSNWDKIFPERAEAKRSAEKKSEAAALSDAQLGAIARDLIMRTDLPLRSKQARAQIEASSYIRNPNMTEAQLAPFRREEELQKRYQLAIMLTEDELATTVSETMIEYFDREDILTIYEWSKSTDGARLWRKIPFLLALAQPKIEQAQAIKRQKISPPLGTGGTR